MLDAAALCLFFSCCFIHLFFFFSLLSFAFTLIFPFFLSTGELQILRRMDHPNIVRLIGVSISPDSHYHIVTELCRCALNDLLDRGRGRLPDHILIDITLQMVHGMKYLHENKIGKCNIICLF